LRFRHLVLDTTHLATGGFDPIAVFERLKERVVHVHLSNFDGREHVELRQGELDLAAFIRHLKESGYAGTLCLEIMPEYFPSEDESFTRRLLEDNLALIRENLA
jgi:sugar phosphate isomerase/epimerase